ncbi:MAG TPA: T9SS type A sorting domain-containing protein [Bacteroidia bacterium]|jgi:hypothetical protein|nr:T9SS type A sorting domain-containing protein [Bacteroidia bacterium]HMU18407.1 T9SS type A sorting domain-containing protein [Bacteroidia bacterium]
MKIRYTLLLILFVINTSNTFAWWNDILVYNGNPVAQHSLAAKSNGTLYLAVPDSSAGMYSIQLLKSTNDGNTWLPVSNTTGPMANAITKTKMVRTGSDSVYCLYSTTAGVYLLNVETGVIGAFTSSAVADFDAAGSPAGNVIYLFVNEPLNFTIKRYTTLDGGLTWGGSTATVTSSGQTPKVYMSGTRLILNYYGPVNGDPSTSKIRAATYDESVPGTIAATAFIDIVTNTAVKKKQFKSVYNFNTVWFFFTEGDTSQVIKCRISTDNGNNYGAEQIVAGNNGFSNYNFDACHYEFFGAWGCYLTYYNSNATLPPTPFPMMFTNASLSTPSVFSTPVAYSDFNVVDTPSYHLPAITAFSGTTNDVGVAWIENSGNGNCVYFDRMSASTGIHDITDDEFISGIIFNSDELNIRFVEQLKNKTAIQLSDVTGKIIYQTITDLQENFIAVKTPPLTAGVYLLHVSDGEHSVTKKLLLSK